MTSGNRDTFAMQQTPSFGQCQSIESKKTFITTQLTEHEDPIYEEINELDIKKTNHPIKVFGYRSKQNSQWKFQCLRNP